MTIGSENAYPTPDILSIEMWNITAIEVGIEVSRLRPIRRGHFARAA
jgi:hypothetical protein